MRRSSPVRVLSAAAAHLIVGHADEGSQHSPWLGYLLHDEALTLCPGPNLGNVGREILFRGEQRGAEEADIAFDLVEGSHGAAVPTIRRASVACRTCTPTAVNISSASCCPAAQLLDGSISGCAIASGP